MSYRNPENAGIFDLHIGKKDSFWLPCISGPWNSYAYEGPFQYEGAALS